MKNAKKIKNPSLSKSEMKKITGGAGLMPLCDECIEEATKPQVRCSQWHCY